MKLTDDIKVKLMHEFNLTFEQLEIIDNMGLTETELEEMVDNIVTQKLYLEQKLDEFNY